MPISEIVERLVTKIEAAKALDPGADALAAVVRRVVPQGATRDALSGLPLGHPLHPALVALPIGAWASASWLDLTAGKSSRKAASRLVALGIVAAGPTALAGASDWLDTTGGERRVGFVHALGNDVALGLYIASWLSRHRGRHARGRPWRSPARACSAEAGGSAAIWRSRLASVSTPRRSSRAHLLDGGRRLDDLPEGRPIARALGDAPVLLFRRGSASSLSPIGAATGVGRCTRAGWMPAASRARGTEASSSSTAATPTGPSGAALRPVRRSASKPEC